MKFKGLSLHNWILVYHLQSHHLPPIHFMLSRSCLSVLCMFRLIQLFCGWMVSPYFSHPHLTFSRQIYAFQGLVQCHLCENFLDFPLIVFCVLIAYHIVLIGYS